MSVVSTSVQSLETQSKTSNRVPVKAEDSVNTVVQSTVTQPDGQSSKSAESIIGSRPVVEGVEVPSTSNTSDCKQEVVSSGAQNSVLPVGATEQVYTQVETIEVGKSAKEEGDDDAMVVLCYAMVMLWYKWYYT